MSALAALDQFLLQGRSFSSCPKAFLTKSSVYLPRVRGGRNAGCKDGLDLQRLVKMVLGGTNRQELIRDGEHVLHPLIRKELITQCGISEQLYMTFEVSISPYERGNNFVDFLDDLQLGVDWEASLEQTREHLSEAVEQKLVLADSTTRRSSTRYWKNQSS